MAFQTILDIYQYFLKILNYFPVFQKKLKHQNLSIQRSLLTLNSNNFSKFASPKEVLLVSKINFPPLNNLSEHAEEASGALNWIKTCFTLGNESLLKMVSVLFLQDKNSSRNAKLFIFLNNLFWFTLDNFLFPI